MPSSSSRVRRSSSLCYAVKLVIAVAFVISALVIYISRHSVHADVIQEKTGSADTAPTDERDVALGLDHFTAHCARCHGDFGRAETELGKSLGADDLTSEEVQSKSDQELFAIISKGVPGTAMPAFSRTHSPDEIRQIILFLRRLPALTSEEKAKLESLIPEDERHKHEGHGGQGEHDHSTGEDSAEEHSDHPPASENTEHQHHHDAAKPEKEPKAPAVDHHHERQTAETNHDMAGMDDEHAGHEMGAGHSEHDMSAMMSSITGGPFRSMHAMGSGTSLMPATTPGYMWHWMKGDWLIMAHGDLKLGFNHQGGMRGVNKAESQNWLMLMAEHPTSGGGRLMLRGMFSAEPWTTPNRGFPELFQTGESFEGRPIIDAQHPHDLFMELAASYTMPLSENISLNLYGGPVAEPALGPVAFMHRASASENPAAPLSHHWQDSTHITHGVFTAGVTAWRFRMEGSIFHGAEPDENRKDIELGKLDSWSARIWYTPTPNWTMQFSRGHLTHPEALEPGDLNRTTASIAYNRSWRDGNWATSLIWGRNSEEHGDSNAYLLESTLNFADKNYLYTRMELVDKIGLLQENIFGRPGLVAAHHTDEHAMMGAAGFEDGPAHSDLAEQWFRVGAFAFGGVRDIVANSKLRIGLGADVTFYHVPGGLEPIYGSSPKSFHLFLRIRPGKMSH